MNHTINSTRLMLETFGTEIEGYGISKKEVAFATQEILNQEYGTNFVVYYDGSHLSNWVATDGEGRKWNVCSDASLHGSDNTFELVTPVLRYKDIDLLQKVLRNMREKGARSDSAHGCGVHIHIGIKNDDYPATPKSIRNLTNIVKNHERLIVKAIKMDDERYHGYAKGISQRLVDELNRKKPQTWDALKKIHYDTLGGNSRTHYDHSRYHFLNLHAIWDKGTVEFRCFEFQGNLHAGWMKAWIQLCMALVSYSKIVSYARPHEVYDPNEKWAMKNWLNNLGLIGDEFETCRILFLRRLQGDASQKVPAPRRAQNDELSWED